MGRSKGATQATVLAQLKNKLAEYAETMNEAAAMQRAREEIEAEMDNLGPQSDRLNEDLEAIWNEQRQHYPGFREPEFHNQPEVMQERLEYSKACRTAMLDAMEDTARRDHTFEQTAKSVFKDIPIKGKVDQKRWIERLVMLEGVDGDTDICRRNNETLVSLVALCENCITPEQFTQMRTEWYEKEGYGHADAVEAAQKERDKAPDLLFEQLSFHIEEAQKDMGKLDGALQQILSGTASPGELREAYSTLLSNEGNYLMFNAHNCMDDLRFFGLKKTQKEAENIYREWEYRSGDIQPYTIMACQAANPYYAVLDPYEMMQGNIETLVGQPGQDPEYSYMVDYFTENLSGVCSLRHIAEEKVLREFALGEVRGMEADNYKAPTDDSIKVVNRDDRTIILVQNEIAMKNGKLVTSYTTDAPGRLMDATLISDVLELREKRAKLPKVKNGAASYKTLTEALDAMVGMTLGDKAEAGRMDDLEKKLLALQTAAFTFQGERKRLIGPARAANDPALKFVNDVNNFIAGKMVTLDTIRKHKETVQMAADAKAEEAAAAQNGGQIPDELKNLTALERKLKPAEDAKAAAKAAADAERERVEAEQAKQREAEDLRDGGKVNSTLDKTETELGGVQVDESWAKADEAVEAYNAANGGKAPVEDSVNAMITGFVDYNRQTYLALMESGNTEEAVAYGKQALAGESVRQMMHIEENYGNGGNRLRTILQKGGLDKLVKMTLETEKFQKRFEMDELDKPDEFKKAVEKPTSFAESVAMGVMRSKSRAQKKAQELAKNAGQVKNHQNNIPKNGGPVVGGH